MTTLRNTASTGACEGCGAEFSAGVVGRPRRFCSNKCRQRAYRRRQGPAAAVAPGAHRSGDGWALHVGGADRVLGLLPARSVQSIVTSPPYFNLRDYRGNSEQIGMESSPEAYVDALLRVFRAAAQVLRPDGTLWLNLGDTYSSRANRNPARHAGRGHREGLTSPRSNTTDVAPLKSLLMLPARVAIALQQDGWIVRNDVIWHKPNAMPSSVTDRLGNRYEHLFLLTRNPKYYFNLDAIREPQQTKGERHAGASCGSRDGWPSAWSASTRTLHPLGKNPGDIWSISTRPNPTDHYAMFPIDVPLRCIAASTMPGSLVLDPFAGRSTTGRAALQLGRRYLGIDINPEDHDAAAAELEAIRMPPTMVVPAV